MDDLHVAQQDYRINVGASILSSETAAEGREVNTPSLRISGRGGTAWAGTAAVLVSELSAIGVRPPTSTASKGLFQVPRGIRSRFPDVHAG